MDYPAELAAVAGVVAVLKKTPEELTAQEALLWSYALRRMDSAVCRFYDDAATPGKTPQGIRFPVRSE